MNQCLVPMILRILIIINLVLLGVLLVMVMLGCAPLGDEPTIPWSTNPDWLSSRTTDDMIEEIQTKAYFIRAEWHEGAGWRLWTKSDQGGISSETTWIDGRGTLQDALRDTINVIPTGDPQ